MKDAKHCLNKLKEKGFKLTPQRLAVIEYLEGNTNHPSASDLFKEVKKKYPMISFATVYNTLRVLGEVNEIKQLTIGFDRVNIDPNTKPHHHFFCRECGKIIDISLKEEKEVKEIAGHQVNDCQIYFYGICSQCLKLKRNKKKRPGKGEN